MNVGWLERGHEFPTGEVPAAFVARLAQLVEHAPTRATRGMHHCDLCPPSEDDEHPSGNAEVHAVGADGDSLRGSVAARGAPTARSVNRVRGFLVPGSMRESLRPP